MPLNVLLMLSSRQAPAPKAEIDHHIDAWASNKSPVYMATTRVLAELVPGESAVAFYGDSQMGNEFLGVGRFEGYLPGMSLRAAELLKSHGLYSTNGVPHGLRGFVILSHIRKPKRGETLTSLSGRLRRRQGVESEEYPRRPGAHGRVLLDRGALFGE